MARRCSISMTALSWPVVIALVLLLQAAGKFLDDYHFSSNTKDLTASLQRSGRVADSTVGGRGCEHGLLDQAGEAVADALGGAPVEAEDVLVQVPLQVLRADGAGMGAEQPALGEGEHEVDRRQPGSEEHT